VCVLHEYPKGPKCHVCMRDRSMTLNELVVLFESY